MVCVAGKRVIVAALSSLVFLAAGLAASSAPAPGIRNAERICRKFIEKRLVTEDGGVFTQSEIRGWWIFRRLDRKTLKASGVLSESTGLLLKYAVLADDRDLFEQQFAFAKRYLTGQIGLFFWKVSHDGELTANSTASVDDLRIVGACIDAFERWKNEKHLEFALQVAENIRRHEVVDNHLRDFVNWRDWGNRTVADTIRLSYIDLETMRKIAKYQPAWKEVFKAGETLLAEGRMPSGLFLERFNFSKGKYEGMRQNTINQVYCALFFSESEKNGGKTLAFFKDQLEENGAIFAEYDALTGEATKFFESTSVYALLARYALKTGDSAMARAMLERLLKFQNENTFSSLYGSFSDDEIYSFDNLEALLTLRSFQESAQ